MVNRIPAIRELGLFAVIGVLCLSVTCLVFMPAMLAIMPAERRTAREQGKRPMLVTFLSRLGVVAYEWRRTILWTAAAIGLVAFAGATLIQVDADFVSYFSPSTQVRRDYEVINKEIVGSQIFYIVIDGDKEGLLKRWEVLKQVKDLQKFLETLPGITSSM